MATPAQGEPQKRAQKVVNAKKPRGRPFTGRDDPRNGNPKRELAAETGVAADLSAVAEDSSLLDDMRHVRRFPSSSDRTEGHRDCRKWKKGDLKGFMARLADLEKMQAKPPGPKLEGQSECPTCQREPEKELAGPEFMGSEWHEITEILKHKDAILRILPHIDQFDAWLAGRAG